MIRFVSFASVLAIACFGAVATWPGACNTTRNAMTDKAIASTVGQEKPETQTQTAIFAAGCFWGVEYTFRTIEGVLDTEVGYTGGHKDNPTYKEVCSDTTGHAEAVKVVYDPEQVSYEKLLEVFWANHDPTQVDRQGPDVGSQYRSAVFYTSDEQKEQAETSKAAQAEKRSRPIATEITEADTFYRAEEYHQQYLEKTGRVCH
ncbi:MAG: peptide-methionine (S)-S-oxide reductase MsrA [Planctomycetota bacterium]